MDTLKNKVIALIVGKNLPHLARLIATWLGSLLLLTPLFSSNAHPLDPSLVDVAGSIHAPSAAAVQDGLTMGEISATIAGLLAIWASRLISWFRAKNLDWLGSKIGFLIGRSLPSLGRAILVGISALLARSGIQPDAAPDALSKMPLANLIGAVLAVLIANLMSATEDAKRNPIKTPVAGFPEHPLGFYLLLLCLLPAFLLSGCAGFQWPFG